MRAEVYAHSDAHDDVEAAVERCLTFCDEHGWRRPFPMVTRPDDPTSPDLGGALMADGIVALVVPHVADLLYGGVELARAKANGRLSIAEAKVRAIVEMEDAVRRLTEKGAALGIVEDGLLLKGAEAMRLADMLRSFAATVTEWNEEEREGRSARSKASIAKARSRGTRIGRPRKTDVE